MISPLYGKITDGNITGSKQVVITIQDLHCHAEVQRNIAGILTDLDKRFGLKNVYVEGGYGAVDTSWLCSIKDRKLKKEIVETLVDQGLLTGSEYFSVTAQRPQLLRGVEDEALHKANIVRLGRILEKKPYFEREIKLLDKDLKFMKAKYFNARNRSFDRLVEKYRNGAIPADRFYRLLDKHVSMLNENPDKFNNPFPIDHGQYRNIYTYLELTDEVKRINYRRLARQLGEFARLLKNTVPYGVYTTVLEKTGNFSKMDELCNCFAALKKEYKLDLRHLPEVEKYFAYREKSLTLNPIKLIEEEKRLVEEIRLGLAENNSELEVSFLADFYSCFRDFLLNRLSARDYEYFNQRFDKFKLVWGKYAFKDRMAGMADDFDLLSAFYKANSERNTCFLKNMETLTAGSCDAADGPQGSVTDRIPSLPENAEIVVIVAGGFHTEGIKKLLRDRNMSYLAVTPNVTCGTELSSATYAELARAQAQVLANSLQLGLFSQMSFAGKAALELKAVKKDEIPQLLQEMEKRTGITVDRSASDLQKGIIVFDNGTKVQLSEKDGHVEAVKLQAGIISGAVQSSIEALLDVDKLAAATGKALATGRVDDLVTLAANFAAEYDLLKGNGLIYAIAADPQLNKEEMINGVRTELLARFPPDLQKAMAIRTLVDALLRESAERSNWLQIILAIDLLRDVIAETVKIQYATRKETKVFNSDEEMYKELDRYNGAILFLGHGSKSQFKDTKSVLTEVDRVVADLNAEYGEGKWVAVFGGDNYKKENPDIAHVMKYLNDKHHVPVLAIQSDVVTGRGGVDKYIDYVRYIPTMKDENGKTIWGGIREGKPVGPTAVYLGDGFVKGESPRLKKVVSIGGGPITLDETRLAYEKGVPVTYVRAETRFPGGNGVYGALEGWLEGLVGNLEGKSVIKFNRKAGISETTPVSRQLRVEDLLRQATGSQGDIEIEKLPSKNGVAVWMARTTRGIFRFEVLQEKNGQEEVDTFKDDAGSIWLIDEGGSILKTRDAHRLPDAMPQLVRDRFFNAWAYTEVPTSGPSMIDQMLRANNYSEGIVAELTGLKDEMKNGAVIRAPKGTGPEAEYWKNRPYIGQKWTSADVAALELFAYSNFLILEIVGYKQETGDNDPSAPIKDKALADALRTFPDLVEEIDGMTSDRDRLFELLAKAVWGNKFDPSNPMGEGMRFIRDERELAVRKLLDRRKQMIDYNADNAGPEILNDLLLIRQILKIDKYKKVRLQLKYTPLLVSDATRQDLDKTLEALAGHPSPLLKSLAKDLQSAIKGGRLIIVSDDATTVAGINFADRAGRARSMKENADIVIMKGDANYRWIFSNSHWGIDADPRQALPAYFPDTLILRAIKHEVMIGADKDLVEEMNRGKELLWYRNGTAGMVQYIAKTPGAVASDREAGDKLIVNHIVRSEGLAGIRLDGHRRHSHVVYTDLPSGMTKIEKGRLSPAGFNTAFQNRVIPVWEQEKDGITYYYLDLAGVQAKDYEQVLGREAIEIEKQYAQPRSRVTINYFERSGKMRYDEIGDPVLPADIEADLSHFRTIRKGEAWAVGQNILTFLDDIQDMGGLKKDLKAAVKVGNGLTVLKPEVLETIGGVYDPQNKRYKKYHSKDDYIEKKTAQIAKLARTTGNELFISFLEYSPDDLPAKKEYYRKTGITGYVYRENGVLMVYRYAAGESQAVREVRFTTAEQLSSGIENSSEPYKMVYASDLRRLLQSGNVRAIDERIGAFSLLLRPLLLSISSGAGTNMITRGFVENVAFGWDPESLPGITPGHEQNVVNALEDKERPIDDVLAAMGLGEGISHPVKTYVLERLANAGKDEQDRRDLQTAFLKAIFREMLVREKMNGAVLADGELRGILGAKLYEKILRNIPGAAVRISPEAFIAKNDVTAVEFFVRLQAKIRELNADPSPEAINTIIVLAPLGERKTKFRIKHQETFNASSIDAILEAA